MEPLHIIDKCRPNYSWWVGNFTLPSINYPITTTLYVPAVIFDVELILITTVDAVYETSGITSHPSDTLFTVAITSPFFNPCVTVQVQIPPVCVNAGLVVVYLCGNASTAFATAFSLTIVVSVAEEEARTVVCNTPD